MHPRAVTAAACFAAERRRVALSRQHVGLSCAVQRWRMRHRALTHADVSLFPCFCIVSSVAHVVFLLVMLYSEVTAVAQAALHRVTRVDRHMNLSDFVHVNDLASSSSNEGPIGFWD